MTFTCRRGDLPHAMARQSSQITSGVSRDPLSMYRLRIVGGSNTTQNAAPMRLKDWLG